MITEQLYYLAVFFGGVLSIVTLTLGYMAGRESIKSHLIMKDGQIIYATTNGSIKVEEK